MKEELYKNKETRDVVCPRCEQEVPKESIICPFCSFGILAWLKGVIDEYGYLIKQEK